MNIIISATYMNIIRSGLSKQTALLGYHKPPLRVVTEATVMNPNIQVFLQVALLCCVVTTSIGGITDVQKAFSQLENKVKESQEEIKSLHHKIEHLERRLEPLESKGEFGEVQIQYTVPTLQSSC